MERKLRNFLILLCCLLFYPSGLFAQDIDNNLLKINLEQAIDISLAENPTMVIAGHEVELKKQAKKEIIGGLIPEVTLDGSYSRAIKKQTMAMKFGEETTTIKVGMDNTYNGGLNVHLPIFAPALYRSINMSKEDIDLAVEKARASKIDLISEVTKAYMQILLAQDSYRVLLKSYNQAKANFEIVDAKFNQGTVSEYDKIRAEVQMRNLKPSVVSAENAIRLSKLQLKVLMGISSPIDLEVEGSLNEYEQLVAVDTFGSYYRPLSIDLSANTDLKQLDHNEKLLQHSLKLQKTNYMPTLTDRKSVV